MIVSTAVGLFFFFLNSDESIPTAFPQEKTEVTIQHWKANSTSLYFERTNKSVPISQWKSAALKPVDSQRIIIHETSGVGDLNTRQSCAVESAANHNPHRSVQLFMRQPPVARKNDTKPAWLVVLRHYPNVQVIFVNLTSYFHETALEAWFLRGDWKKSPFIDDHLSNFISAVSLFRGGGLFLDFNKVVVIKPLDGPKWSNFFVTHFKSQIESNPNNEQPHSTIIGQVMHLVHGHHLIDMLLLKLAEAEYNPQDYDQPISNALDLSLERICGWNKGSGDNLCLDLHLLDSRDVFLSSLASLYEKSWIAKSRKKDDNFMVKIYEKAMEDSHAVFLEWEAIENLDRDYESTKLCGKLCSSLLAKHCPQTIVHQSLFSN